MANLTNLANSINNFTGRTGVKANLSSDLKHIILENIELIYMSDQSEAKPFLLFDMEIGPDSGFLEITSNLHQGFLAQIWDPWCHYSRQAYKKIKLPKG